MTPERRRLHHAAILAEALDQLRQLALPILIAGVVGGRVDRLLVFGVIGAVVSLVAAVMSWMRTAWWVDGDSIRLRSGIFTERITAVPLERVQAIDTVRGPAQRLLGAVEVHVQTAGGGARGEIVLKAVAPAVAEQLRELARGGGGAVDEPGAPPAPAWRLGRGRLIVAALTSGSLGVLVPVVAAASQVLDDVMGAEAAERLLPDSPQEWLLAAVAVLAVAWVLSVIGTIVAFANFSVTRDGDRLRIARGVIERREASVPIARVGAIRIVESPLREPLGLAQVRIESAGYAKEPASAQALLPLVRRSEVDALVRALLPELAEQRDGGATPPGGAAPPGRGAAPPGGAAPLARPPRRALRRYVLPPVAVAAIVPIVLVALLGPAGLAALALPLAAAAFGVAAFRSAGWRLDAGRLVLRRRGLQRSTLIADARRLPEVFTRVTALQERAGLASAGVAVASGRRAAVAHLEAATARDLLARLGRAATALPAAAGRPDGDA